MTERVDAVVQWVRELVEEERLLNEFASRPLPFTFPTNHRICIGTTSWRATPMLGWAGSWSEWLDDPRPLHDDPELPLLTGPREDVP